VSSEGPEELTTVGSGQRHCHLRSASRLRQPVRGVAQTQQSVLCRRSASSSKPLMRNSTPALDKPEVTKQPFVYKTWFCYSSC
jgi:hypothetical protein